jgi:hypothetical protein
VIFIGGFMISTSGVWKFMVREEKGSWRRDRGRGGMARNSLLGNNM